jgi:hypothetical protein
MSSPSTPEPKKTRIHNTINAANSERKTVKIEDKEYKILIQKVPEHKTLLRGSNSNAETTDIKWCSNNIRFFAFNAMKNGNFSTGSRPARCYGTISTYKTKKLLTLLRLDDLKTRKFMIDLMNSSAMKTVQIGKKKKIVLNKFKKAFPIIDNEKTSRSSGYKRDKVVSKFIQASNVLKQLGINGYISFKFNGLNFHPEIMLTNPSGNTLKDKEVINTPNSAKKSYIRPESQKYY